MEIEGGKSFQIYYLILNDILQYSSHSCQGLTFLLHLTDMSQMCDILVILTIPTSILNNAEKGQHIFFAKTLAPIIIMVIKYVNSKKRIFMSLKYLDLDNFLGRGQQMDNMSTTHTS